MIPAAFFAGFVVAVISEYIGASINMQVAAALIAYSITLIIGELYVRMG